MTANQDHIDFSENQSDYYLQWINFKPNISDNMVSGFLIIY